MTELTKFLVFLLLVGSVYMACTSLGACTDIPAAEKALRDAGYKRPYNIGGYAYFRCGEDDVFATEFTAMSPDSTRKVEGCVCSGLFKGSTIRTY